MLFPKVLSPLPGVLSPFSRRFHIHLGCCHSYLGCSHHYLGCCIRYLEQSVYSLCRRRLPPGCSKVEVSALQTLTDLKVQVGSTAVKSLSCSPVTLPLPLPLPAPQLMHIYGTPPSDIRVYFNGKELTSDELALVELGITPNSLLVVKVSPHL